MCPEPIFEGTGDAELCPAVAGYGGAHGAFGSWTHSPATCPCVPGPMGPSGNLLPHSCLVVPSSNEPSICPRVYLPPSALPVITLFCVIFPNYHCSAE